MNKNIRKKLRVLKSNEDFRKRIKNHSVDVDVFEWIVFPIVIKVHRTVVCFVIQLRLRWIPKFLKQLKIN